MNNLIEALNRPGVVMDRVVLRLGKEDGEFQPWRLGPEDFAEDFEGFLACLKLKEIVDLVEGRMREQKSQLREDRKRIRELQKAEEKANEKLTKAAMKAQKKIEKEEAKKKAKEERDRLKAELKKEKANVSISNLEVPMPKGIDTGTSALCTQNDLETNEGEQLIGFYIPKEE